MVGRREDDASTSNGGELIKPRHFKQKDTKEAKRWVVQGSPSSRLICQKTLPSYLRFLSEILSWICLRLAPGFGEMRVLAATVLGEDKERRFLAFCVQFFLQRDLVIHMFHRCRLTYDHLT